MATEAPLWNAMLDAEMNVCYWSWVANRFAKTDRFLQLLVAATTTGSGIAAWGVWGKYPHAWGVISGIAAIAALIHAQFYPSDRLKKISELVATWKEVSTDYAILWQRDSSLASDESQKTFEATKRRESKIDETGLPQDQRLIMKAYEHVLRMRGLDGRQRTP